MIVWNVLRTDCDVVENGKVRVSVIHWEATDSIDEHKSRVYGSVSVADQDRVFTVEAMENAAITAKVNWVHEAMEAEEAGTVQGYEAALAAQLDRKLNPTTMSF
jgi:hypothetical protein